jgi:hypothetical protein
MTAGARGWPSCIKIFFQDLIEQSCLSDRGFTGSDADERPHLSSSSPGLKIQQMATTAIEVPTISSDDSISGIARGRFCGFNISVQQVRFRDAIAS